MSCHPDLAFIQDDKHWLEWADFERAANDAHVNGRDKGSNACIAALSLRGLFTDYLSSLAQGEVSVELVRQGRINEANANSLTRRDVIIRVGEKTAAVASTLIEPAVIDRYPWLNELGGRAIGETLERRLGAVRTAICYRLIEGDNGLSLATNFAPAEGKLWGRRYIYQFDGGELRITEVIAGSVIADIERKGEHEHEHNS